MSLQALLTLYPPLDHAYQARRSKDWQGERFRRLNTPRVVKNAVAQSDKAGFSTHVSPFGGAKAIANKRIHVQLLPREHATKKVRNDVIAMHVGNQFPGDVLPAEEEQNEVHKEENDKVLAPPMWNAWYLASCHVLHYIGNGNALEGKCKMCGNIRPQCQNIMLDHYQLAELK